MSNTPARTTLVRAARAVDAHSDTAHAWLFIGGDTIEAVGSGREAPLADEVIDLGNATLVPGFIDLHSHGGAHGAYDDGADEIQAALALHRQHGTTRSVLSLVANPIPLLSHALTTIRDLMESDPLVLGAHLEGPFLSPSNHGAHAANHLLEPTPEHVDALLTAGAGVLRQITIAPELAGAMNGIRRFVDHGVVAAVGHTVATEHTAQAAFDAGVTILTHAFNAMPGIHHRTPGPILAAIADDRVTLELILDGVHVAPSVARILFRAAPGRVALVTDAMSAAGAADGRYPLGSLSVDVIDGVARVAGTDTIAGSTLTQDAALRNAVEHVGVSLQEAVTALTSTPATALGLGDRFGQLAPGHAADIVALTPDLQVSHVWAAGLSLPMSN